MFVILVEAQLLCSISAVEFGHDLLVGGLPAALSEAFYFT
jgi:hypothetical protein